MPTGKEVIQLLLDGDIPLRVRSQEYKQYTVARNVREMYWRLWHFSSWRKAQYYILRLVQMGLYDEDLIVILYDGLYVTHVDRVIKDETGTHIFFHNEEKE